MEIGAYPMVYVYLLIAIITEVAATSALKASEEFTRFTPSLIVIIGYGISFYCLTQVLKFLPVGITYAIWSGAGIILVTLVGIVMYREIPDWPAVVGMGLIIAGVVVINIFSKAVGH